MAAATVLTQPAAVNVVFDVTGVTARRRLTVFLARRVAGVAGNVQVRARQGEVGKAVVEHAGVDSNNVCIPTFVVSMAGDAFLLPGRIKTPVKTAKCCTVTANVLVTACAQCGGCLIGTVVMAGATVVFRVRVPLDNPARHQKGFETHRIRRAANTRQQ